jgi:hypothetical protein
MSEEQIHDIVMGTIHAAIDTGDLVSGMPSRDQLEQNEMGEPPENAAPMAPQPAGPPPPPMEQPPQPEMMGQGQ